MDCLIRVTVCLSLALMLVPRISRAADPESGAGPASYLEGLAPPAWRIRGAIESYTPANLYEKINGRSELYMAYAVTGMAWVALESDNGEASMEVFLYDMQTPLSAFGVYSMERSPDAPALALGRQAYQEGGDLFCWKGSFYLTVRSSGLRAAPAEDILRVGRKLADRLGDEGAPLWGTQILPPQNLDANSIQYFMADALALDFLTDTFTARYASPRGEVTAFLSRADSAESARKRRGRFIDYLEAYGGDLKRTRDGTTEFVSAEMLRETFDVVFQFGKYLAGVTSVPDRDHALAAAREFREGLRATLR